MTQPDRLPLSDVSELLRDHAPRLRDGELEAVKLRVLARAPKGPAMRTRLAITTALVVGLMMSLSGVALGISGISSSGSAGTAQYSTPGGNQPLGEEVPGQGAPGTTTPTLSTPGSNDVIPAQVQPSKQTSNSPVREIPFTGFLAIPVLLIGVALMLAGTMLRRRVLRA
jgi:hypothetical protein